MHVDGLGRELDRRLDRLLDLLGSRGLSPGLNDPGMRDPGMLGPESASGQP